MWENGNASQLASGNLDQSIPCERGVEAQAPASPLTPIAAARAARTQRFCTSRSNALLSLERALSGRPDAFAWQAVRARVEKLEERLAILRTISTPRVEASEKRSPRLVGGGSRRDRSVDRLRRPGRRAAAGDDARVAQTGPARSIRARWCRSIPWRETGRGRCCRRLPRSSSACCRSCSRCNALVREREENTLDVLLATPRMTLSSIIAGKSGSAVVVTCAVCLSLLVVMHVAYDLFIKSGLLALFVFGIIPAAAAAALLGVAVSAWTSSSLQATIASAIYLLVQALVGGLLLLPGGRRCVGRRLRCWCDGLSVDVRRSGGQSMGVRLVAGLDSGSAAASGDVRRLCRAGAACDRSSRQAALMVLGCSGAQGAQVLVLRFMGSGSQVHRLVRVRTNEPMNQ